jgi:gas vesicle protein
MGGETKSHTLTGLLIGAVVGAAVGGLLLATHCSNADPDTQCSTGGGLTVAVVFAIPGALTGAVIGSLIRTKR